MTIKKCAMNRLGGATGYSPYHDVASFVARFYEGEDEIVEVDNSDYAHSRKLCAKMLNYAINRDGYAGRMRACTIDGRTYLYKGGTLCECIMQVRSKT